MFTKLECMCEEKTRPEKQDAEIIMLGLGAFSIFTKGHGLG